MTTSAPVSGSGEAASRAGGPGGDERRSILPKAAGSLYEVVALARRDIASKPFSFFFQGRRDGALRAGRAAKGVDRRAGKRGEEVRIGRGGKVGVGACVGVLEVLWRC